MVFVKIAVAVEGNLVSEHFGHCEGFAIFEAEGGQIKGRSILDNPAEHQPGFLPGYLARHGVNVIIAGGMGQRAKDLFAQNGIRTITGVSGPVLDAVKTFLAGNLKGTDAVCEHHGEHQCGHEHA